MTLEVKNINKSFGEKQVLRNININLHQGEIVSLLGVSGCGKTTLFNIISGLISPDSGNILLNNQDITNKSGEISYMLQKDMLLPHKTVLDNVALPLIIKDKNIFSFKKKKIARETAAKYFKEFGLEGYEKKYPSSMSGGMRQRAALLRTYLFSDQIALLDEPFSALDTFTKSQMHQWYLGVMEQIKLSTIFITHDIDEAILLSDRIYILAGKPGEIIEEIKINKQRPRDKDFILSEEFINYKREISHKIISGL